MNTLVFSDESGDTHNGLYIRAWIGFSFDDYNKFSDLFNFLKYKTNIKEIKFNEQLRILESRNASWMSKIFEIDFNVFITITDTASVNPGQYSFYQDIEGIDDSKFNTVSNNLKSKILSDARHQILLNKFEKQHLYNAYSVFKKEDENIKLVVDSPQYLKNLYLQVAQEVGFSECQIENKSEGSPGIQLAGIIATCVHKILTTADNYPREFFSTRVKSKMFDMYSSDMSKCNPNIVFYEKGTSLASALAGLRKL